MSDKYRKTGIRREHFAQLGPEEIFALAEDKMRRELRFLDPYLTLDALAGELNVHRNALSGAVNRYSGMNFPRWLNTYRVDEVERLAQLPENHAQTLDRLAMLAGFSNRNSFYRMYKITRNKTPGNLKIKNERDR